MNPAGVNQAAFDEAITRFYTDNWDEGTRLVSASPAGQAEFRRVQEIVRRELPPQARILDVGGATGIHSRWLAEERHDVTLIDPVEAQVREAQQGAAFEAVVGDARELAAGDKSVDAVLLFGPLYHLHSREDRVRALREAHRVLLPGGVVLASGISRIAAVASEMALEHGVGGGESWRAVVEWGDPGTIPHFPVAHFHTCDELESELTAAGFESATTEGIEGFVVGAEFVGGEDPDLTEALLTVARRLSSVPHAKETSNHLMAIAHKPRIEQGEER